MTNTSVHMGDGQARSDSETPYLWSFAEPAHSDQIVTGHYDVARDVTFSDESRRLPLILSTPRRSRTNTGTRIANEGTDWD